MKKFFTLIRREIWEYKTGFIIIPTICTLILCILLSIAFIRFAPAEEPKAGMSTSSNQTFSTPTSTPNSTSSATSTSVTTTTEPIPSSPGTNTNAHTIQGSSATTSAQSLDQQFNVFSSTTTDQLPLFSHMNTLKSHAGFVGFSLYSISIILSIILLVVLFNYAHKTLFEDRKNREVLFWRSMPVSETQNLTAKLTMIYGLAPAVALVLTFFGGLLCGLAALIVNNSDSLVAIDVLLFPLKIYITNILTLFALSPIITWALLASAYAKKSPFMISAFLPIGLMFADRLVNWATGIDLYLRRTIHAYWDLLSHFLHALHNDMGMIPISTIFLIAVVSGFFMVVTIWLRNNRYEI